ncbi:hypothetical protein N0V95_005575 [Ascochyta clinopodiicola]|nr:hypothetical protein N0V95_005575 [Ascochyta clinopodiicola]
MSTKIFTAFLLAAGLAASKPISSPHAFQVLAPRQDANTKVDTSPNPGYDMVSALAALESKAYQEVVQINAENIIVVNIDIDNGKGEDEKAREDDRAQGAGEGNARDKGKDDTDAARGNEKDAAAQQLMLEQVNQALVIDQRANAANKQTDNVLRAMALTQKEPEKSTVILVVKQINISIEIEVKVDNKKTEKKKVDASLYKQEAIVANRGKQETQTIMVYDPRTLTAADVTANPSAPPTDTPNITYPVNTPATKTVPAVLYNARPTHTSVVQDPAPAMRAALEGAIAEQSKEENRAQDVALNIEIAVEIKVEIEKADKRGRKGGDGKKDEEDKEERKEKARLREQKQEQKEREQKEEQKERGQQQEKAQAQADADREDKQGQDKNVEGGRQSNTAEQKGEGEAKGVKVTIGQ